MNKYVLIASILTGFSACSTVDKAGLVEIESLVDVNQLYFYYYLHTMNHFHLHERMLTGEELERITEYEEIKKYSEIAGGEVTDEYFVKVDTFLKYGKIDLEDVYNSSFNQSGEIKHKIFASKSCPNSGICIFPYPTYNGWDFDDKEYTRDVEVLASAARDEELKDILQIWSDMNVDVDEIDSLVLSRKLGNSSVPWHIKNLLKDGLKICKDILPRKKKKVVKNTKIVFEFNSSNNDLLWLHYDSGKDIIEISPYLIRAMFVLAFNRNPLVWHAKERLQTEINTTKNGLLDPSYQKYWIDDQVLNEEIWRSKNEMLASMEKDFTLNFLHSFMFSFSHELAHAYLVNESEEKRDCYAKLYLQKIKTYAVDSSTKYEVVGSIDIFKNFVEHAVKNEKTYLWGISDKQNIYIEKLKNRINTFYDSPKVTEKTCKSL